MVKSSSKRVPLLIGVLILLLTTLLSVFPVQAAEGGPVNVGYLVEEDFSFLPKGTKVPSGWDADLPGCSISYSYNSSCKIIDENSSLAATLKKSFITQTSGKITLECLRHSK